MSPRETFCTGLCAALLLGGSLALRANMRLDHAILAASRQHGVDHRLLLAVARKESRMRPDAVGAAGEIGLFQIMPNTARHWAEVNRRDVPDETQLFRPELNAEIAAWYLRRGLGRFAHRADPLPFALAYYNAGPSRALVWDREIPADGNPVDHIPFPGTRNYVRDIVLDYRGARKP